MKQLVQRFLSDNKKRKVFEFIRPNFEKLLPEEGLKKKE